MSDKMLVTQALDERDLLVKKIADKIAKASFVDTIKPNEDKVYAKRIARMSMLNRRNQPISRFLI